MMWDKLLDLIFRVADKALPDPQARDQFKLAVLQLEQAKLLEGLKAETTLALGQLEVNKIEAASDDPFKSGWRPAVGWVCVLALAYQFLGQPLLQWGSGIGGYPAPPTLELSDLMTILLGMLGLSGLRTAEKFRGVS